MPSTSVWLALAALAMAGVLGCLAHDGWDRRPGGPVQQLAEARAQIAADQADALAAAGRAEALAQSQAQISAAAGAGQAQAQVQIRTVTRTLVREVPRVLSPETDRRFPLPVGLVRLHDAAWRGLPLAAVPDPAGRADDAASDIRAGALADALVRNAGACRADAAQLAGLEAWLTDQAAAAAAPH